MERTMAKRLLALLALLLPILLTVYAAQFSLKSEIERRIADQLTAAGLSQVGVSIDSFNQQYVFFSRIGFTKGQIDVVAEGLKLTGTSLPYRELLHGNYSNIKADWSLKALTVSGIPYPLPPLTGEGKFYMQKQLPVIAGAFHDAANQHAGRFTVSSTEALLEDIRLLWQGAILSAHRVTISLAEQKPIRIPLEVRRLPLTTLLALLSGEATGTGLVSGKVELIIFPDGSFSIRDGAFGTDRNGIIRLSADALPGDQPQMETARKALANFHYKDLKLTVSSDKNGKPVIHLNLEGNNPDAFDGRAVKLQVNLSGDVLELLQQTMMPMADPQKLIEKENQ